MKHGGRIFVSVGTTDFDDLVQWTVKPETLAAISELGYKEILIQIGRGEFEPEILEFSTIKLSYYRYKPTLKEDIESADLVISHAGAGSCLEVLEMQKPLIVVINETLMNNHQLELAAQLFHDGHCMYCTPQKLSLTLKVLPSANLKPWVPADKTLFASWLRNYLQAP